MESDSHRPSNAARKSEKDTDTNVQKDNMTIDSSAEADVNYGHKNVLNVQQSNQFDESTTQEELFKLPTTPYFQPLLASNSFEESITSIREKKRQLEKQNSVSSLVLQLRQNSEGDKQIDDNKVGHLDQETSGKNHVQTNTANDIDTVSRVRFSSSQEDASNNRIQEVAHAEKDEFTEVTNKNKYNNKNNNTNQPRDSVYNSRTSVEFSGRGRVAVLILDFQNEFAKPGGKLHESVAETMKVNGVMEKVPKFVKAARTSGALMIYSPVIMRTGARFEDAEYDPDAYSQMHGLFTAGTWNSKIIDEIQPIKSDLVLGGRNDFCAFEGTDLLHILKLENVSTLVIIGFLSNICVEATSSRAKELIPNLQVIVCSDGCAAKSLQDHINIMTLTLPVLGIDVRTCAEVQMIIESNEGINMPATIKKEEKRSDLPRILAMHGKGSNDEVTRMQLENIGITNDAYDIVYIRGPFEVDETDPAIADIIHGPFFSWFSEDIRHSVVSGVRDILRICKTNGPFDGVYGFSNGAVMAMLAANIKNDHSLQSAINTQHEVDSGRSSVFHRFAEQRKSISRVSVKTKRAPSNRFSMINARKSTKNETTKIGSRSSFIPNGIFNKSDLETGELVEAPFKFIILACAVSPENSINELRKAAGLFRHVEYSSLLIPSFHIVGVDDPFKPQSEDILKFFANRKVMYIPATHEIPREVRNDEELKDDMKEFISTRGNSYPKVPDVIFKPVSDVSSIGLLQNIQVALVKLDQSKLPGCNDGGATIRAALKQWPAERPFLRASRNSDPTNFMSYGDVVHFIEGGEGDLRRIGVRRGDVVAYGAPPGGGAVPALAFMCIGAQATAAPIAPGTTEPDALDALDQFKATQLILFDGVDNEGVISAFNIYAKQGKARLHRAAPLTNGKPGMFKFVGEDGKPLTEEPFREELLRNPEDGTCLLLRTSGTTSRPKGVPLLQDALINNGAIIAASMQLKETDVCYSVMPLFHIGGISGSILCTLASGGSVCCDGEPYSPSQMVDALALSRPQPTWYSSVPTIHNATVSFLKDVASLEQKYLSVGVDANGIWATGHSLRMIRSGAAALLGPDGRALSTAYGGIPIFPTYSMSEQMPISQPPAGKEDTLIDRPGSVGVPVASSTVIVNKATLRPVPYGIEGEVAISGPTILKSYLDNPEADRKNYFDLTLDIGSHIMGNASTGERYFLTGDVGVIDQDGFLSLKGRAKELIKKGGEQVSPLEVEEFLLTHPWVKIPICFSVPSKLYGEEVGCALVLSSEAPANIVYREINKAMRAWLKEAQLAPVKWPTKWIVVAEDDLPKTKTNKFIRIGLSSKLGLDPKDESDQVEAKAPMKARIDWATLGGLRFFLACYVMFMHLGSSSSWGRVSNLRGFPWHVHCFFTLGGYSMSLPMNPFIQKKFAYFKARISNMYPMYIISVIFLLINLVYVCRPSTFDPNFHWNGQPDDASRGLFCEGTPATPNSYWGSLVLTIFVYLSGLAITPGWLFTWWLGYYLWFSSMYYQCLAFFPATYNFLYTKTRHKKNVLVRIIICLFVLNIAILTISWFLLKDTLSYKADYESARDGNIWALSFYLFSPFWALYFVIGTVLAFLYDAYHPRESHNVWIWGWVADTCSLIIIAFSFAQIFQGKTTYDENPDLEMYLRPDEANQWTDTAAVNRLWDNIYARLWCPLTTLWIFSLSTGQGFSARFFSQKFLSETLSPNAYNCFLFHQQIGQWYYAATRRGEFWNWWSFRKTMYWFSPKPCPIEWYEYFYVVGLVIGWSRLMFSLEPIVKKYLEMFYGVVFGWKDEEEDRDTTEVLLEIIEGMTGIEPSVDWTLEECGLASIGVPSLVSLLNKNFSSNKTKVTVVASNIIDAETIADVVDIINAAKELADAQGI